MLECPNCLSEITQNTVQCAVCGYQFAQQSFTDVTQKTTVAPQTDIADNAPTTNNHQNWREAPSLMSQNAVPHLAVAGNRGGNAPSWTSTPAVKPKRKIAKGVAIIHEGDDIRTVHIVDGKTSIGRDEDCTIILSDERVSSLHGIIYVDDHDQRYLDISSNGSEVNGQSCHYDKAQLDNGARIMVGDVLIVFMLIPQLDK